MVSNEESMNLFHNLENREQWVQQNNTYSELLGILFGMPQESIPGSLLFDIFLGHLFSLPYEIFIANYTDKNTPSYTCL